MFPYINTLLSIGPENKMTGWIALKNKTGDRLNIHSRNFYHENLLLKEKSLNLEIFRLYGRSAGPNRAVENQRAP